MFPQCPNGSSSCSSDGSGGRGTEGFPSRRSPRLVSCLSRVVGLSLWPSARLGHYVPLILTLPRPRFWRRRKQALSLHVLRGVVDVHVMFFPCCFGFDLHTIVDAVFLTSFALLIFQYVFFIVVDNHNSVNRPDKTSTTETEHMKTTRNIERQADATLSFGNKAWASMVTQTREGVVVAFLQPSVRFSGLAFPSPNTAVQAAASGPPHSTANFESV